MFRKTARFLTRLQTLPTCRSLGLNRSVVLIIQTLACWLAASVIISRAADETDSTRSATQSVPQIPLLLQPPATSESTPPASNGRNPTPSEAVENSVLKGFSSM